MKLLIVSDAWEPQTNGVVTTIKNVTHELEKQGFEILILQPGLFTSFRCPGYEEIDLSLNLWDVGKHIKAFQPDFMHIAVEGPLGIAARHYMTRRGYKFTTSFHTKFPEYINKRLSLIPVSSGYAFLRWFHKPSQKIMVTTPSMERDLKQQGFNNMVVWGRGVNTQLYYPNPNRKPTDPKNPVMIYVGRVAVEKSIDDFLKLDIPGHKIIVGDGPSRVGFQKRFPNAEFVGFKYGAELRDYFQKADVFVFPSRTDTFGLVMLEAMACGAPVAAYPVPGPLDVVQQGITGVLNENLALAIEGALKLDRQACRDFALQQSWQACANRLRDQFVSAGL
ncbi:MAG: glycosyltransferase family 1 protein [Gammaproteobacteria bacterium]|nr:glycosyltransferase family 1 protein [Gammaproteobacteria bacterium]